MAVPPRGIEESDFELIEAAVRETERGRWFLDEFAQRVRSADVAALVRAIDRLEGRASARREEDEHARRTIQRAIALLIPLIEFLDVHEQDTPRPDDRIEISADDDPEARMSGLSALDALSVADKLKLFR